MNSSVPVWLNDLSAQLHRRVLGQETALELALASFLSGGHLLLEGPPGVGKTSLAKGLASLLSASFRRLQMTSDLLPSDLIGVVRINPKTSDFEFRPGPIFTEVLLVDELNRAGPKTQSALLEAMEEEAVSVDGRTYPLPSPFFVVATQNPQEFRGVFPLSESQLDRFSVKLWMDPPSADQEKEILLRDAASDCISLDSTLKISLEDVKKVRATVLAHHLSPELAEYIVRVVQGFRNIPNLICGVSVRAGLQWARVAKAYAFMKGRDYVIPQDLLDTGHCCLGHRLVSKEGELNLIERRKTVDAILAEAKPPR